MTFDITEGYIRALARQRADKCPEVNELSSPQQILGKAIAIESNAKIKLAKNLFSLYERLSPETAILKQNYSTAILGAAAVHLLLLT